MNDQQPIPTPRCETEFNRMDLEDLAIGHKLRETKDFARTLERELVQKEQYEQTNTAIFKALQSERDKLLEQLEHTTWSDAQFKNHLLVNQIKELKEERDQLRKALSDLVDAITDFGGHGMPGFIDRAVAYLVIAAAKEALNHSKSTTQ